MSEIERDKQRERKGERHVQRRRRRRGRLLIPRHGKAGEEREKEKRGWWRKKSGEWEKQGE